MEEQKINGCCANCGASYKEGAAFCGGCGSPVGQTAVLECANAVTEEPVMVENGTKVKAAKVFSLLGIACGVLSVLLGISAWDMGVGAWEYTQTYGGDAYTGIQNAAAQTANNVQELTELIRFGTGALLFVLGVAMICHFACRLAGSEE